MRQMLGPARSQPRRRGIAQVYLLIALPVLVMLLSLAVDWGRVQVVRAELQVAADFAAKHAAGGILDGTAFTRAQYLAGQNRADGTAVALLPQDVELGNWDPLVTPAFSTARSPANAVRVTARREASRGTAVPLPLAGVVGVPAMDLQASAIATFRSGFGIVGIDGISVSGNGATDSYDSRNGAYSSGSAQGKGDVWTNGDITIAGNAVIKGDARPGAGRTVSLSGNAQVTGQTAPLTDALPAFPLPTQPPAPNVGSINLSAQAVYDLPPGNYRVDDLTVAGQARINITGPTRVYVYGAMTLTGGFINTANNKPSNLEIYVMTGAPVSLSGQADLHAKLYAPLSAVTQSGQANIYGTIVGRTLTFTGSWQGGVHVDQSMITKPEVKLVQ